ncbi:MAG: hypothetical protein ACMXYE_04515 [Candidatus Woesearchaeota archaeon]
MEQKKGQTTLFIIIAVAILLVFMILILIQTTERETETTTHTFTSFTNYMGLCAGIAADEVLTIMAERALLSSLRDPTYSITDETGETLTSNIVLETYEVLIPFKDNVTTTIQKELSTLLNNCTEEIQQYEIIANPDPSINVDLTDTQTIIEINWPLQVRQGNTDYTLEPINLMYNIALEKYWYMMAEIAVSHFIQGRMINLLPLLDNEFNVNISFNNEENLIAYEISHHTSELNNEEYIVHFGIVPFTEESYRETQNEE